MRSLEEMVFRNSQWLTRTGGLHGGPCVFPVLKRYGILLSPEAASKNRRCVTFAEAGGPDSPTCAATPSRNALEIAVAGGYNPTGWNVVNSTALQ
jgi:hypothetical protein